MDFNRSISVTRDRSNSFHETWHSFHEWRSDAKSRRRKKKWLCSAAVIYSGAVRRKRVSEQVALVEARTITGTSDIKYGSREGEAPKSHLRVASSPSPLSAGSVGKAGITRAKRTCGASRLIVWKMAYCLHLPTTCTLCSYPTILYTRLSSLERSSRHLCRAPLKVQINSTCRFFRVRS